MPEFSIFDNIERELKTDRLIDLETLEPGKTNNIEFIKKGIFFPEYYIAEREHCFVNGIFYRKGELKILEEITKHNYHHEMCTIRKNHGCYIPVFIDDFKTSISDNELSVKINPNVHACFFNHTNAVLYALSQLRYDPRRMMLLRTTTRKLESALYGRNGMTYFRFDRDFDLRLSSDISSEEFDSTLPFAEINRYLYIKMISEENICKSTKETSARLYS